MEKRQVHHRQWPENLLVIWIIVFLATAIWFHSVYLTGCGGILLWLGIFRMLIQKYSGSWNAILLFLPAAALCGLSAISFFMPFSLSFDVVQTAAFCVLIVVQMVWVIAGFIMWRAVSGVSAWMMRHFNISLLCVLLSALVSQLLLLGDPAEWAQMVCLTGCVMGGIIFLLGGNFLLCALCGNRTTRESIRMVKKAFQKKRRFFYFVSVGKDGIMLLVKLGMSLISTSFFMFANALFSCGIGLARYTALKIQGKDSKEQLRLYRRVMAILSFSGLCYVGYSVRLFFGGSAGQYGMVMALAIAVYTFVEFGIQIYELLKLRKQHDLEAKALRIISFCGILVSFVLTQTAIMSFSELGEHNVSDGLAGVIFGGLVVLVGLISIILHKKE